MRLERKTAPWLLLAAALSCLLSAGWAWRQHRDLEQARQSLALARAAPQQRAASQPPASASAPEDWVLRLPARLDSGPLIASLQDLAGAQGVLVQQLQVTPQPATADQLGRIMVSAQLQGPYPAVRSVLAHWSERHPLHWQQLQLSLATGGDSRPEGLQPGLVQARLQVAQLGRPGGTP